MIANFDRLKSNNRFLKVLFSIFSRSRCIYYDPLPAIHCWLVSLNRTGSRSCLFRGNIRTANTVNKFAHEFEDTVNKPNLINELFSPGHVNTS